MKISFRFCLLSILLASYLTSHAQSPPPGISWKRSDRLNYYPPQLTTVPTYTIDHFSEDWWYDHKNSYEGGEIDPENFNGFITCGYSAIRNAAYVEDDGGCFSSVLASPPTPPVTCDSHMPFVNFEDPDGYLGHTTFQIMARYDPYGNLQWFKSFNQLWFIRVIQTSDGNYVAVGPTSSTREEDNTTPIYYNPTTANPDDAFGAQYGNDCGASYDRKVNVVKVDPEGNIIWNYIYGVKAISDPDCALERYMPYDLVEYDQGSDPKIRIVGRFDPHSSGSAIGYESAFMIDINSDDGYFNWAESFDPDNTTGTDKRYFKAIEKIVTGSGEFLAVTGTEEQSGQKILDVMYVNAASNSPVSPVWQKYFNGMDNPSTSTTDIQTDVYDVCFSPSGDLLVPLLYNCNDCGYTDNWSEAAVFRLSQTDGSVLAQYPISDGTADEDLARAFDLMIGITNTSDGGFAIVTSKRPEEYKSRYDPFTIYWPCHGGLDESSYSYWGADAFVRKFDASGNVEWSKTWDIDDAAPEVYPGDLKKQECMYSITETPDGGFVVSGNNSRNFDDCYLVKLYDNCQNTDRRYDSDDWSQDEFIDMTELTASLGSPLLSNNYTIRGSVIVGDGETLEINNGAVIEFADTRKCGIITNIVVEEGGTLIIHEGATLTSLAACDNSMWDGVQIWGDNTIDQSSGQANMFISDDATIENARVGILGDKGRYVQHENIPGPNQAMIKDMVLEGHQTHGGALLEADNAHFRNNRFSVLLHAYPGEVNNSFITNSRFILDQPINDFDAVNQNGDRLGINTFIVLFDVHGIIIDNNDFEISHSFAMNKDRGVGLGSFDSDFQLTQNNFKKLETGLAAGASNSLNTFGARCNDFDELIYGMDIRGVDFFEVHDNTVTIEDGETPFGMYLENCTGYMIQDNSLSFSGTSSTIAGYFGIVNYFSSQNSLENQIQYNTINNFASSFLLEGHHMKWLNSNEGLELGCNTLTANLYDINVSLGPGIAGIQNGTGGGANNIFANGCNISEGQIHNPSGMNPIEYTHMLDDPPYYVEPASGCYTTPTQVVPTAINVDFDYGTDCNRAAISCAPQFSSLPSSTQGSQQVHLRQRFSSSTTDPELLLNEQIRYYLHNRHVAGRMDSVIQLLETNRASFGPQLAAAYAKVGNSNALTLELSDLETDPVYINFSNLSRLKGSTNWSSLRNDTAKLNSVRTMAIDSTLYGHSVARNILQYLNGESFSPVIVYTPPVQALRKWKETLPAEITVFPNPFDSQLSITLLDKESRYQIRLHNVVGHELLRNEITGTSEYHIQINDLADGMYFLVVLKNELTLYSYKLIRTGR